MASITQTITLVVTVLGLNVDGAGQGIVSLERSPSTQRSVPPSRLTLLINPTTLKYMLDGVAIWDVSPAVLTGPGADSLAAVIGDMNAATAAGVLNI